MMPQANTGIGEDSLALDHLIQSIFEHGGTIASAKGFTEDEVEAIYTISYNLYNQHKFDQAEKTFTFLCLYSHLDPRFWIGLGAAREALKKYQSAIEAYSYSALLQHDNPIAPLQAATCYLALNDLAQAERGLTAAIHWAEQNPLHKPVLAKAQALLGALHKKRNGG
jgi:type III secretion system low calcium response chaperone LcrH/SycD